MWDIEKAPKVTRYAERVLNPLVGKSLVVYLEKPRPEAPARRIGSDRRPLVATGSGSEPLGDVRSADREAVA